MRLIRLLRRLPHRNEPFVAERTGARLTGAGICGHGHLLFAIRLLGTGLATGRGRSADLVMTRCHAADLVGTLLALTATDGGVRARDAFLDEVHAAETAAAGAIARRAAETRNDTD